MVQRHCAGSQRTVWQELSNGYLGKIHSGVSVVVLAATVLCTFACGCHESAHRANAHASVADGVVITTPHDSAFFKVGDDIPIAATVEVKESVQRLEFWSNGAVIKTLDRPPFRMTISKAGPGGYRLHAVAHTATQRIASPQIGISVMMSEEDRERELTPEDIAMLIGGAEPRIFIDAPTPGTTLRAPADISIEGWAVFPAAQMKDITVLGDGKPLVTFTSSPFKHVWRGVGKGRHVVAIRAVDVEGRTMQQSETVNVR